MYRIFKIFKVTVLLIGFVLPSLLLSIGTVNAQSPDPYTVPKQNGTVTLDGKVDEPAWQAIDPLPLVTHWPSFGEPVDLEKTQLRIAHDEEYLYVICVCHDDPENISAPIYKRNHMNMAIDGVAIILDTFNDSENGLLFNVTPTGSSTDAAISNDAQGVGSVNNFWDTIREAEAVITDFGWTVEMRVPFSS